MSTPSGRSSDDGPRSRRFVQRSRNPWIASALVAAAVIAGAAWLAATRRSQGPTPISSPVVDARHAAPGVPSYGASSARGPTARPDCRALRIVDARRRPVAGVQVCVEGRAEPAESTDADGEVAVECTEAVPVAVFFDGETKRRVELREPLTMESVAGRPLLDVQFVDGRTGAFLAGSVCRLGRDRGTEAIPLPCLVAPDARGNTELSVSVDPPAGYGAVSPFEWRGPIAARATRVCMLVPVFPARDVVLRVVDESGTPLVGATASDVRACAAPIGGLPVTWRSAPSDSAGRMVLSGVPQIPFATLSAVVSETRESDGTILRMGRLDGLRLDEPASATPLTVVLSSERIGARGYRGRYSSFGKPTECYFGPPRRRASITVRAVFRDGRPAARVAVSGRGFETVTGADGSVLVEGALAGPTEVLAVAHGFLPTLAYADVGRDAEVVLRESAPRAVRVTVVDEADRPLPAACVTTRCAGVNLRFGKATFIDCSVAQVDGDVELLTPLTAADGTVTLQEPVGTVRYHVVLGGATQDVESSDDVVRVVLRASDD